MGFAAAAGVATAVGLGLQAHQGIQGVKAQKQGLQRQDQAQKQATSAATSARLQAQTEINKADRKRPDIATLLASAQADGATGLNSTMLTGRGGFGGLGG